MAYSWKQNAGKRVLAEQFTFLKHEIVFFVKPHYHYTSLDSLRFWVVERSFTWLENGGACLKMIDR